MNNRIDTSVNEIAEQGEDTGNERPRMPNEPELAMPSEATGANRQASNTVRSPRTFKAMFGNKPLLFPVLSLILCAIGLLMAPHEPLGTGCLFAFCLILTFVAAYMELKDSYLRNLRNQYKSEFEEQARRYAVELSMLDSNTQAAPEEPILRQPAHAKSFLKVVSSLIQTFNDEAYDSYIVPWLSYVVVIITGFTMAFGPWVHDVGRTELSSKVITKNAAIPMRLPTVVFMTSNTGEQGSNPSQARFTTKVLPEDWKNPYPTVWYNDRFDSSHFKCPDLLHRQPMNDAERAALAEFARPCNDTLRSEQDFVRMDNLSRFDHPGSFASYDVYIFDGPRWALPHTQVQYWIKPDPGTSTPWRNRTCSSSSVSFFLSDPDLNVRSLYPHAVSALNTWPLGQFLGVNIRQVDTITKAKQSAIRTYESDIQIQENAGDCSFALYLTFLTSDIREQRIEYLMSFTRVIGDFFRFTGIILLYLYLRSSTRTPNSYNPLLRPTLRNMLVPNSGT